MARLPVNLVLGPERPYPAAVDDADAAYRGLGAAGFSKISFVGDSAGGGLALVTAVRLAQAARSGAVCCPAAVVAMSPWTDLTLTGENVVVGL